MSTTQATEVSRGDKASIWAFLVAGAAIIVTAVVQAANRLGEVLGSGPTPVHIAMPPGTQSSIPYPGGSLDVEVDTAVMQAQELPLASEIAGAASPIVWALVTISITVCLSLLAVSILRGRIFSRRNTRLVTIAGLTGLIGYAFAKLLDTMLANGAVAWASDQELDNLVMSVNPFAFIIAAFAIAVVATVFTVGERLQRETEGLV